jgi:hypothetical protein
MTQPLAGPYLSSAPLKGLAVRVGFNSGFGLLKDIARRNAVVLGRPLSQPLPSDRMAARGGQLRAKEARA